MVSPTPTITPPKSGASATFSATVAPGTLAINSSSTVRIMNLDNEFDPNGNNFKSFFNGTASAAHDRNAFEKYADRALTRNSEIQLKLAILYEKESTIMDVLPTSIDDSNLRDLHLTTIRHDIAHWNAQIVTNNEMYTSYKQTSVKLITILAQIIKLDDAKSVSEKKQKDHSDIPAMEIPVFVVKYSDFDSNPDVRNPEDYSLKSFICKFERVYNYYGVDVELHWLFHLEASFENNDLYKNWFRQNFKSGLKNKKKSWSDAKKIMEHRFDPSARLGLVKTNVMLRGLKQYPHEKLAQFMDRYGACVCAAKVQTQGHFFLTVAFLMSLYTNKFQEKVKESMHEYMNLNPLSLNFVMPSKHANLGDIQFFEYYSNFGRVYEALNHFLGELEVSLKEIQLIVNGKPPVTNTNPFGTNISNKKNVHKKRKLEVTLADVATNASSAVNLERMYDRTHASSDEDCRLAPQIGKCLSCRIARFSENI
ncbi:uncharacterized protein EV154DRAFT_517537 [Mucor mucedo]|uniref:uncharacterized protein n=1 Tax=Mucor mucedo TaxID=29922 RepID=UPI00221F4786|nr:uncharacterized protein EV154DRAFT_517537 [Mucor mucedo]KAI7888472.1 hypothetical protein EV154DRAFT_517537 [Mucor mucedo]